MTGALVRLITFVAMLSTGLLAGAFGRVVNVAQAFMAVPPDAGLRSSAALAAIDGPFVQATMVVAMVSTVALAVVMRGATRWFAAGTKALVVTSFLIARFGIAAINGEIAGWATGAVPPDYADVLQRWEMLHIARTVSALAAFLAVIGLVIFLKVGSTGAPSVTA